MDWEVPYAVSRSLTIEVRPSGRLAARSSISRPAQELSLDALPVLQAFASGTAPREAMARLRADWELEEDGFAAVVDGLLDRAFLVPARRGAVGPGGGEPPLAAGAFASVLQHHSMLLDAARVLAYQAAIARHSRGCSVGEIGCGSGILSIFAARAGARRVVAIEESEIADLAERMFRANGCEQVELRRANSRDVELDEPADLIIHEILGTDPFAENLLPAIVDARERFLRPGGRLLPYRLEVVCLGLELAESPHRDRAQLAAEARELERLYGVSMAPLIQALGEVDPRLLTPVPETGDRDSFQSLVLSGECLLLDVDFRASSLDVADRPFEVRLPIERAGTLGGVVLFFRAHLDEQTQLASSPFGRSTNWALDVRALSRRVAVAPGDRIPLRVELRSWLGRQMLSVDLVEC